MRALLLLSLGAAHCAWAAPPPPAAAEDEKAIRAVLSLQEQAWNRGDLPAFMTAYENSPSTTFVGATVTRGYQPVLESYAKRYPTPEAMGKLKYSEIEVHQMGGDYAWVLGRFHLARKAAGGGDKSGRYTLVFKKIGGLWKIVLDHTS